MLITTKRYVHTAITPLNLKLTEMLNKYINLKNPKIIFIVKQARPVISLPATVTKTF